VPRHEQHVIEGEAELGPDYAHVRPALIDRSISKTISQLR